MLVLVFGFLAVVSAAPAPEQAKGKQILQNWCHMWFSPYSIILYALSMSYVLMPQSNSEYTCDVVTAFFQYYVEYKVLCMNKELNILFFVIDALHIS